MSDKTASTLLRRALATTGLVGPAFRVREALRALGYPKPPLLAPDGLPFPSRIQMVRVAGHADWRKFYQTGRDHAEALMDIAAASGVPFDQARSVLDWGCGCGRVSRHIAGQTPADLFGRDPDPVTVRWAARNLPGNYKRSRLVPPLDLSDRAIDIAVGLSIFTHLSTTLQREWLQELARILRPGGLLLLTFADELHPNVGALGPARAQLDREGIAQTTNALEGLNYMATFQTRRQLGQSASPWFREAAARTSRETPMGQAVIALVRRGLEAASPKAIPEQDRVGSNRPDP